MQFTQCIFEYAGQGFGQAAEDAHELAGQLAARGCTAEALRGYEAARVHRMKRVADTEWVSRSPEHKAHAL
jgi:2-polyprenyl-6-methoxyphenol hydroxylase-like FAD-dependent oxidoreductase